MPPADKFLGALKDLQVTSALESLDPKANSQTEFGYGKACGIVLGLRMAEELLQKTLHEQDREDAEEPEQRARSRRSAR